MSGLTEEQSKLYKKLEGAVEKEDQSEVTNLLKGVSNDDLLAVLTAAGAIEEFDKEKRTETLLALAISYDRYKAVEAILRAAKKLYRLKKVLASVEVDDHEKVKTTLEGSDILNEVNSVLNSIITEKLHSAAKDGDLNAIQTVLQEGADVNATNQDGFTALRIATFNNNLEIVQALLEKEADVNIQSNDGYIALYDAAKNNRLEIVQAILDKGADVNIASYEKKLTALHIAAYNGHSEIVQALLDKGANVNAITKQGCAALYGAAENGHLKIVQALLDKGADVNIATYKVKFTALHIAASNGHTNILKSLLPKATYPLLKDIEGNTPIDLIKDQSAKAELQKLIEDLKTQDTAKPSVTKPGNQNSNTVHRVEGSAIKTAIKAGLSCSGVISIVGVCFAAGSQTPILAIVGTAAAAVSFGLITGIFAYAVSKPSSKVEKTDARQGQDPLSQTV